MPCQVFLVSGAVTQGTEFRGCFGPLALCGLCPESRARHTFRGFSLLTSFSDALLVVSILDILYDYHLWPLLQS